MLLIIAYGNPLRRDDGAGLRLGEMLEATCRVARIPVERLAVQQLTPELTLEMAREGVTAIAFVDTRVIGPAETDPTIEIAQIVASPTSPAVGHHFDPGALLAYVHLLYGQQPVAWRLTIPGVDFNHGEGFSPTTQAILTASSGTLDDFLACLNKKSSFSQ